MIPVQIPRQRHSPGFFRETVFFSASSQSGPAMPVGPIAARHFQRIAQYLQGRRKPLPGTVRNWSLIYVREETGRSAPLTAYYAPSIISRPQPLQPIPRGVRLYRLFLVLPDTQGVPDAVIDRVPTPTAPAAWHCRYWQSALDPDWRVSWSACACMA